MINLSITSLALVLCAPAAYSDVVTDWNKITTDATKTGGFNSNLASRVDAIEAIAVYDAVNSKRNSMAGPLTGARQSPRQQRRRYAVSLSRPDNSNCSTSSANGSRKLRRPAGRFGGECAVASPRSRPSCLGLLIAARSLSWAAMSANGKTGGIGERHRSSPSPASPPTNPHTLAPFLASELSRKGWVQAAKPNLESWQRDLWLFK